MPLDFKTLPMMELRSAPGEILDRVARNGEAFVVERNGQQMACLVPLSVFGPDIQPARIARELNRLREQGQEHTMSISDEHELEFHFHEPCEGSEDVTLSIRLPHGYPNACPKVFADPIPDGCPHKWPDGSLCIFGAMEMWNPGRHDVSYVLTLARRWLTNFHRWKREGEWGNQE